MKRNPPRLPSIEELLDAVPTCNLAVRAERQGDAVLLWVPLERRWWMGPPLGWFLPFRSEKGVALDVVGSEVWAACDGQRRVEEIIEGFAARHRLRFHEARLCVSQFLKSLVERRLLVLAITPSSERSSSKADS